MRLVMIVAAAALLWTAAGCGDDAADSPSRSTEPMSPQGAASPHPTVVEEAAADLSFTFVVEAPAEDPLPALELDGQQVPIGELVRDERSSVKADAVVWLDLDPGGHELVARHDDGEADVFNFESGEDQLYMVVSFWGSESMDPDSRTEFTLSPEPIGVG